MEPVEDRSSLTTLSLDQALKQLGVDAVDGLRKKENGKKQKKIKHKKNAIEAKMTITTIEGSLTRTNENKARAT